MYFNSMVLLYGTCLLVNYNQINGYFGVSVWPCHRAAMSPVEATSRIGRRNQFYKHRTGGSSSILWLITPRDN